MAQFPKFTVVFDDGTRVDAQASSRDLVGLEKAGVQLSETAPVQGSYILAHAALSRLKRLGKIDVDVPETADELMDLADIEAEEDPDDAGNGSGQAPTPG